MYGMFASRMFVSRGVSVPRRLPLFVPAWWAESSWLQSRLHTRLYERLVRQLGYLEGCIHLWVFELVTVKPPSFCGSVRVSAWCVPRPRASICSRELLLASLPLCCKGRNQASWSLCLVVKSLGEGFQRCISSPL